MSASWLGLVLLAAAWLVQLPVVHQLHLVFDHVEHVWCPVHHRLEHLEESAQSRTLRKSASSNLELLLGSSESRSIHDACPLSLMHQLLVPVSLPMAKRAIFVDTSIAWAIPQIFYQKKVLSYSPKLSPPCMG